MILVNTLPMPRELGYSPIEILHFLRAIFATDTEIAALTDADIPNFYRGQLPQGWNPWRA